MYTPAVLTRTPITSCLLVVFSSSLFLTETLLLWGPWTCYLFPSQEIIFHHLLQIFAQILPHWGLIYNCTPHPLSALPFPSVSLHGVYHSLTFWLSVHCKLLPRVLVLIYTQRYSQCFKKGWHMVDVKIFVELMNLSRERKMPEGLIYSHRLDDHSHNWNKCKSVKNLKHKYFLDSK